MNAFLIGLSAAVTGLILYLWSRVGFWRAMYQEGSEVYDSVLDRALAAERECQRAESELMFLKQTVVQMLQKPAALMLSDEQFSHLVTSIGQIAASAAKAPERMN